MYNQTSNVLFQKLSLQNWNNYYSSLFKIKIVKKLWKLNSTGTWIIEGWFKCQCCGVTVINLGRLIDAYACVYTWTRGAVPRSRGSLKADLEQWSLMLLCTAPRCRVIISVNFDAAKVHSIKGSIKGFISKR